MNFEKVDSFILKQIRISEICLFDYYRANNTHINNDLLTRAVLLPVGYRSTARGKAVKGLIGPTHKIFVIIALSGNKCSGKSAHMCRLARAFLANIHGVWI